MACLLYTSQMTGGRIPYLESVPDAIKNACCAVADQLWQDEQQGDKASETVGSHSVSYQNRDASQKKKRYDDCLLYTSERAAGNADFQPARF